MEKYSGYLQQRMVETVTTTLFCFTTGRHQYQHRQRCRDPLHGLHRLRHSRHHRSHHGLDYDQKHDHGDDDDGHHQQALARPF